MERKADLAILAGEGKGCRVLLLLLCSLKLQCGNFLLCRQGMGGMSIRYKYVLGDEAIHAITRCKFLVTCFHCQLLGRLERGS